jgi:hypothetical protein
MTHVEVQYTVGCPNAAAIMRRLKELAHRRGDLTLTLVEVAPGRPVPAGFAGSPTVLIDGTNPFGGAPTDAAACTLRPPTVDQVERAAAPH